MAHPQQSDPMEKRGWNFYIHKIQRTYAIWLGLLLFIYSLTVFGVTFLAPYVLPAIKLLSPLPLEEREIAATQFLVLGQTVWPAIIALIIGAALFSIYLTHRLAGPLYRLEQGARELLHGNLTIRVRLRKGDQLQELAELANLAMTQLDRALSEIRARGASGREALGRALAELRTQPSIDRESLQRLEIVLKEEERIEEVLKGFQLSPPRE